MHADGGHADGGGGAEGPEHRKSRDRQSVPNELRKLIRGVLSKTKVIPAELESAVEQACGELWPQSETKDLEPAAWRSGTLHLLCGSHARLAEVQSFYLETLRERINQSLEASRKRKQDGLPIRDNPHARKDALYVTRIQLHLMGTY